jgi:hypothetical protein
MGCRARGRRLSPLALLSTVEISRAESVDGCHLFVRHATSMASLAFCISLAASVSLIRVACCCTIFALIPGFKYCCQSGIEVSFSYGVW